MLAWKRTAALDVPELRRDDRQSAARFARVLVLPLVVLQRAVHLRARAHIALSPDALCLAGILARGQDSARSVASEGLGTMLLERFRSGCV
jgi:hypothetical protein